MVKRGDRVRLTGPMKDDPDPIPVGSEGTVGRVTLFQIDVDWDNGRQLFLLPEDSFVVLPKESSEKG